MEALEISLRRASCDIDIDKNPGPRPGFLSIVIRLDPVAADDLLQRLTLEPAPAGGL